MASSESETQRVIKTLIIGLGSTGTQICNAVADRIRWELNDLRRAPWVQFLCVETNANEASPFHDSGDFLSLRISGADYSQIVEAPQTYDEKIGLSQWVDRETLRKLPNKDVSDGAGNIRMVGRLAFLFEGNFNQLKIAVTQRFSALRLLSEVEAMEARGTLTDGSDPAIEFAADGEVRVIVVGTLCGGTCSGLASDIGYFLKSICRVEEKTMALFTLPRQDLTTSLEPAAAKYKSNAYHALIELNHYHLAGREDEPPIRFPDGVNPDSNTFPYDLTFLSMPRSVGSNGEMSLNRALADRIFLNVFVPQSDPFANAINAPVMDREHRAHVFCAFGLASIEFPAYQVMEACEKRLLAYGLREWNSRSLSQAEEESALREMGFTWDGMLHALGDEPGTESIANQLGKLHRETINFARTNIHGAENSLEKLRSTFERGMQQGQGIYPGMVSDRFMRGRTHAAELMLDRVRGYVATHLLNYHEGPAPILQIMNKAQERIQQLQNVPVSTDNTSTVESVNSVMRVLRVYHTSPLLGFFFMKRRAVTQQLPVLEAALKQEISDRLNGIAGQALRSTPVRGGIEAGMLERMSRLLAPVQKRLNNLRTAVTALATQLHQRADELASTEPLINGISVFEPETPTGGTVREEYKRCLLETGDDPTESWEHVRDMVAAQVIRAWENLPSAVVPAEKTRQGDWLIVPVNPHSRGDLIPALDLQKLETVARSPFLRLAQVNVLERWQQMANPILEVRKVAECAYPFLEINKAQAERGGRPPIEARSVVLAPSGALQEEFRRVAQQAQVRTVNQKFTDSPDLFRAVLLEEWFRFPLSGVTSVLGKDGLHCATCNDFPTLFTRMDVGWTGLSDREITDLRRSEELLTCAVLLGIVRPEGKALVMDWQEGGFGDEKIRRLPLSLRGAMQSLANQRRDLQGRPLDKAMLLLEKRIAAERKKDSDIAFIQRLQAELKRGTGNVIQGWKVENVARYLDRYCANYDEKLYLAYTRVFPPDPATIDSLRHHAGDARPRGGFFEEDGLYCSECGGLVGVDEQDAAKNGWRCFVDPEHYFGPATELIVGG